MCRRPEGMAPSPQGSKRTSGTNTLDSHENITEMKDIRVKISTLWVVVMFNMAFADIVGFLHPGAMEQIMRGEIGFELTPGLLLVFSILLEIPIVMIFLSRVLKYRANRWANIIAGAVTILFVIAGGSAIPSYMFFATVEVACMSLIIWYAWKWPDPEGPA